MKMFLDTSQLFFAIAIFDDEFKIIKSKIEKIVFKVEALTNFIDENKINLNQINEIYLNIGPGSFTGVRVALVYAKTISQLCNSKIFIINSFILSSLLNKDKEEQIVFINKYKSLILNNKDLHDFSKVKIEKKDLEQTNQINYKELINNFTKYKSYFKEENNLENINPLYILEPQIGDKK
ncbi:MAG: hypothetical protein ACRDA7_00775 [Metamycoplasmataceae bacterium]